MCHITQATLPIKPQAISPDPGVSGILSMWLLLWVSVWLGMGKWSEVNGSVFGSYAAYSAVGTTIPGRGEPAALCQEPALRLKKSSFFSEATLGDGEGPGSLVCCRPWGRRESDMTW